MTQTIEKDITNKELAQMMTEGFGKMQNQIDEVGGIVTRGFDRTDEEFKQVKNRLDHVENKVNSIEIKVGNLESKVDDLTENVQQLDIKVDLIDKRVNLLSKHMAPKMEVDILENRVKRLEATS